jgi:hypothetical protein
MAWYMGGRDLWKMRTGLMDRSGYGMTNAGRILGMIVTLVPLSLLFLCCTVYGGLIGWALLHEK